MPGLITPFSLFQKDPIATSEIIDLRVYPIKSCRGVSVPYTVLTRQGLAFDRQWMFVDASTNKFLTIRGLKELTLIHTAFEGLQKAVDSAADGAQDGSTQGEQDGPFLLVTHRNDPSKMIRIPASPQISWLKENTRLEEVEIWGQKTDAYVYSDEINSKCSDIVGQNVKLVYKGPTKRLCRGSGATAYLGREEDINFPDMLPVLVANHASIKELNTRLAKIDHESLTIERFRPNIIVRGGEADGMPAWSEDRWKMFRIPNNSPETTSRPVTASWASSALGGPQMTLDVDVAQRCARCQVPNVNPDTAEKSPKQPWDMLMSYRRVDEGSKYKPCFGMLSCPRNEGRIAVGMKFELMETRDDHKIMPD